VSSRKNSGEFGELLAAWSGAESVEARAGAFRVAEVLNLVYAFLTQKR
jgi:hypothetical protein